MRELFALPTTRRKGKGREWKSKEPAFSIVKMK
jgi:hypothetical protein